MKRVRLKKVHIYTRIARGGGVGCNASANIFYGHDCRGTTTGRDGEGDITAPAFFFEQNNKIAHDTDSTASLLWTERSKLWYRAVRLPRLPFRRGKLPQLCRAHTHTHIYIYIYTQVKRGEGVLVDAFSPVNHKGLHQDRTQISVFKSHLVRTQTLNVHTFKPGVSQYIAIHTTLTARDFFLAFFYPSSPFTCIFFPKPLPIFFPCWLWLTHGSCVGPQNKIGHPAGCRFPCWVPAEYK